METVERYLLRKAEELKLLNGFLAEASQAQTVICN
jgi:hypothetical protein